MNKKRIFARDSKGGKAAVFILTVVMIFIIVCTSAQITFLLERSLYNRTEESVKREFQIMELENLSYHVYYNAVAAGIKDYQISDPNIRELEIASGETREKLWEYSKGKDKGEKLEEFNVSGIYGEGYTCRVKVAADPEPSGNFYLATVNGEFVGKNQKLLFPVLVGAFIIAVIGFICLMAAAGHKKDCKEIKGSFITGIPFDLYTFITGAIGVAGLALVIGINTSINFYEVNILYKLIVSGIYTVFAIVIFLLWCMDLAVRLKTKGWWKNTLIYRILKYGGKIIWKPVAFTGELFKEVPLVKKSVIIMAVISFSELIVIMTFGYVYALKWWIVEKIILFPCVILVARIMRELETAGKALSEGDLDYKVNTEKMFWDFKKHGENLNSIGDGMNAALYDKLKSERMKTELITNVSHDIKTPLTSIINYSDLIGKEKCDNEKIKEYSEVLNRQSVRLKRLIEDLVEASKASTGNLDVNPVPSEAGVMLVQTAGEYEDRLEKSNLQLIVTKPDHPVNVMADGRRLWRVMDNILNNVCKYAQPGTRVYLNLYEEEDEGVITLKNISREQLDISADELMERFVRGDKSRNTDGSGLGLSIARSLTELQGGTFDIEIDGDHFKVTVKLRKVK